MTLQGLLRFVHVLGVVLWMGAAVTLPFVTGRAARADTPGVTAFAYRINARLMTTLGLGGMILTLVGGVWLTAEMGYEFFRPFPNHWLFQMQVLGIASALVGALYQVPLSRRLAREADRSAESGTESEDFARYRKRYAIVGSLVGLVLFVVLVLATVKP
mgnify:FL=1